MMVKQTGTGTIAVIAVASTLALAVVLRGGRRRRRTVHGRWIKAPSSTLTVWVDAERVDALQGAADAYEDRTGVAVDLVGKDTADIKDDFIQQVPTGEGPYVAMGAHDWLGAFTKCPVSGRVSPIRPQRCTSLSLDLPTSTPCPSSTTEPLLVTSSTVSML